MTNWTLIFLNFIIFSLLGTLHVMASEKYFFNTDCNVKDGYLRFSDENHFKSVRFLPQTNEVVVIGSLMKGRISRGAIEYIEFWKQENHWGLFSIKFIKPAFSGEKITFGRLDIKCWKEFMENLSTFKIFEGVKGSVKGSGLHLCIL